MPLRARLAYAWQIPNGGPPAPPPASPTPPSATTVLRRKNSYTLSLYMLPLFTFITVYIGCFYIIQKVGVRDHSPAQPSTGRPQDSWLPL